MKSLYGIFFGILLHNAVLLCSADPKLQEPTSQEVNGKAALWRFVSQNVIHAFGEKAYGPEAWQELRRMSDATYEAIKKEIEQTQASTNSAQLDKPKRRQKEEGL